MAFGILSPSHGPQHVGGTSLLDTSGVDEAPSVAELERGTGKHAETVLSPQPSKDPNDPLRWPLWQRDLMFLMHIYCTILCVGGWNFWMLAIFLGLGLALVLLFAWETAFERHQEAAGPDIPPAEETGEKASKSGQAQCEAIENADTICAVPAPNHPTRKPFLHRLAPFSGVHSQMPLWEMILKPFLILTHPAVVFVVAQIFTAPPYSLEAVDIGYMSAGPVIGGTLGSIVCGLVSDPVARALARRNRGVYEPEFRLVLIIPMLIASALGWFLFGNLVVAGTSPSVIAVVWAITTISRQFGMTTIGAYILDGISKHLVRGVYHRDGVEELCVLWAFVWCQQLGRSVGPGEGL
ncbi:hypothetical protein KXV64_000437 [Aspergillus fumigatus]|nr:hypothetical protein KXX42_007983 [Aspergillus fumigatus]KAH1974875.1 hypothetical protein KXW88_000598 [Aspergillus fumigatus]KAH2305429.1 hypothetical protein KXV47_008398 [Aspergillus fumigatus]KAH2754278.1 hypothetical protein KXV94_001046 [Aspergillus fumigatus]KAH3021130.1 hypothetical protein KXW60_005013 [Aspergillus fumigatus]